MKKICKNPIVSGILGLLLGIGAMWMMPQQQLTAGTAHGNDKFSMVTVPVTGIADTEAVFVLDHLTGVLTGGQLNAQNGTFATQYVHNVGADFQVPPGDANPGYAIVSGSAQINGGGAALGALYIAEKNSGAVIAYAFPQRGRGNGPQALTRIANFRYRAGN